MMAPRIRSLKPDCWQDEALGIVCPMARLLFVGLITQADDDGRLRGAPALVNAQIFPYDTFSPGEIEGWLDELAQKGLIQRYEAHSERFIVLRGWKQNQRISHPVASVLPNPPEPSAGPPESSREPVSGREWSGEDRNGVEGSKPLSPGGDVEAVFSTWIASTGKDPDRTQLDDKRKRLIRKALASYPLEEVLAAVKGWQNIAHNRGENDRGRPFNDLGLLLRDSAHIERFRDAWHVSSAPLSMHPADVRVRELLSG